MSEIPAVRIEGLRKNYAGRPVLDGLSFSIRRGEVFALLGPNGAGKTTTVEILEGFRVQDSGSAEVLGERPATNAALKQRVGIMPQQSALYPQITVVEALTLFSAYYANPVPPDALLKMVGLVDRSATRFKVLSGGERQRLSLALALVGNPELVFLDEPTASMDPQARLTTWALITSLRSKNVTVLLTTHYLEEAQRLADRVAIMQDGRLLVLGTPDELTRRVGGAVRFSTTIRLPLPGLEALPGCATAVEERPGTYALHGDDPDELAVDLAIWSRAQGVRLRDLRVERASLEEVFLQLTSEDGPA